MITVNPITISAATRFQVSFDLAPPYPDADEFKVAGDGNWSVQCGVVERLTMNPVPEYGTIFVEVSHNIAAHEGEPAPLIDAIRLHDGVDQGLPWDPEYGPNAYCVPMDPVPHGDGGHFDKSWIVLTKLAGQRAWHVEVNSTHASEELARKAHRRPRGGCLFPFWWVAMPLGPDFAAEHFERMKARGEIRVGSEEAAAPPNSAAKPKPRPKRKPAKGKKK